MKLFGKKFGVREKKLVEDFLVEIKLISSLSHPNIIRCIGISVSDKKELLLIIEYMHHGSLRDLIDNNGL